MRRSLLLCLLLLAPGCSFWAVRGPDRSVAGGGQCTTSVAAPVVDGILAAGLLGGGIAGVSQTKPNCSPGVFGCVDFSGAAQEAWGAASAFGAVEAIAAVYGAMNVASCNDAKASVEVPRAVNPAPGLDLRRTPVIVTR